MGDPIARSGFDGDDVLEACTPADDKPGDDVLKDDVPEESVPKDDVLTFTKDILLSASGSVLTFTNTTLVSIRTKIITSIPTRTAFTVVCFFIYIVKKKRCITMLSETRCEVTTDEHPHTLTCIMAQIPEKSYVVSNSKKQKPTISLQ